MPIEWTSSDPDLLLRLARTLGEPLRVQLERALRQSIQSGGLEAGDCYAQLETDEVAVHA
jgi:GntR family transcriptional regulator / MocR family aminotransferase